MVSIIVLVFIASVLVRSFAFKLEERIVGGIPADIADFPYQLSLQYYQYHMCGASIISDNIALTAAHCTNLYELSPYFMQIRAGSTYHASGGQLINISVVYQHGFYDSVTDDYDVGALSLDDAFIKIDKIPLQPIGEDMPADAMATISGWGRISSGGPRPDFLKKTKVAYINDAECASIYGSALTDRMFCFGSPGKGVCEFDSGGPLVFKNQLVGIISWRNLCADVNSTGVYTKISHSSIHNFITDFL